MISGPTIPNTLENLRELLVQRSELIEHGLHVVTEDLVLGVDTSVDVLACDATGAPVLLFIAVAETAADLPSRLVGALSWWRRHSGFLARELADPRLDVAKPPRCVVVGLHILAETLDALQRSQVDGLSVLQLCSLTVGGRLRVGLTQLLPAPVNGHKARNGFAVPDGLVDPAQRALAGRFLDLVRRVDPSVCVSGDRFSRALCLDGEELARLGLSAGRLRVEIPGPAGIEGAEDECFELTEATCPTAVDRVLRVVLAREVLAAGGPEAGLDAVGFAPVGPGAAGTGPPGGGTPVPAERRPVVAPNSGRRAQSEAPVPVVVAAEAADRITATPITATPITATPITATKDPRGPVVEEERFSLEPIRRSVARAQLSREEFSALGDDGSDSG